MAGKEWSTNELLYLHKHYPTGNVYSIALHLNRSKNSVVLKANRIGIVREEDWSNEEISYLQQNYFAVETSVLSDYLGRTDKQVRRKASLLGLQKPSRKIEWTKEMDEYLVTHLQTTPKLAMAKHLKIDRSTLIARAEMLNLNVPKQKPHQRWSTQDVELLKASYGKEAVSVLSSKFNKNYYTVIAKARAEGLAKPVPGSTLPEKQVELALTELNIPFRRGLTIKGVGTAVWKPDFLVSTNVVIEVNGNYWHCNPRFYAEPINKIQVYALDKDKRKREFYEYSGYSLIEIWEDECQNYPNLKTKLHEALKVVLKPDELLESPESLSTTT